MLPLYRLFVLASSLLLGLLTTLSQARAQAPTFRDAQALAASGGEATGTSIAYDAAGNSYATGYFQGTVVFGNTSIKSVGGSDIYVAKQDPAGNYLWVATSGGSDSDQSYSICVDSNGNALLTGFFYSSQANFGAISLNSIYGYRFVAKLTANGTWAWAVNINASGNTSAIAVDGNGDAVITGSFSTTSTTIGSTTLTNTYQGTRLTSDLFVAKISAGGNWLWAIAGGSTDYDYGTSIAFDASGNAYLTGSIGGTQAQLGSFALTGVGHMLVAKVSPAGIWLWAQRAGNAATSSTAIVADGSGNTYLTGSVNMAATPLGPLMLAANVAGGPADVFVAKISTSGIYQWAVRTVGSSTATFSSSYSLALDSSGGLYLGGMLAGGTTSFGTIALTNSSSADGYVARLSPTGNWLWAQHAGSNTGPRGLAADGSGNAIITGTLTSDSASFGTTTVASTATPMAYIAKLTAAGNFLWNSQSLSFGSVQVDQVVVDAAGNRYQAGNFKGSVRFGATQLISLGSSDLYVTKQDAAGNYLWAVRTGSTGQDYASKLAVDASGNVYLGGSLNINGSNSPPFVIDFGTFIRTTYGGSDMLVAKLSSNGVWQWATMGGTVARDNTTGITTDAAGNVYLVGYIEGGTATFGSITLTSTTSTLEDIVVAKLDAAGNWLWAVRAGGNYTDYSSDIELQGNNIYVSGYLYSTSATFGNTVLTSQASPTGWVAKLDLSGNWQWAVGAGTAQAEYATGDKMAIDGTGNVYVAGYFASAHATFGTIVLTNKNPAATGSGANYSPDIFVAKLTASGSWQWAVSGGGTGSDYSTDLLTDPLGNVYLVGNFCSTTATFGPSTLTNTNTNNSSDIVVARLDANGNWQWAISAGGAGSDSGSALAIRSNGEAYLWGLYASPTITLGSTTLVGSLGVANAFVARLDNVTTPLATTGGQPASSFSVWPNPSTGAVSVAGIATGQAVQVFDVLGRLVLTQLPAVGTGALSLKLPAGLYIVRTHNEVRRLVIQ